MASLRTLIAALLIATFAIGTLTNPTLAQEQSDSETSAQPQQAPADSARVESLWEDFNHYVLIARYDVALEAGQALLQLEDANTLLDVIEGSDYRNQWDAVLLRASKVETLKEVAEELARRIQNAKIERAREPERIMSDIRRLAAGPRANMLATQRLKAAGQYSAPFLLSTLQDPREKRLHPYILAAMVEIGRPLVYPLSESLLNLDPVQMGQIAQVLAEIGYPRALPYLREVIESPSTDPSAQKIVQAAYDRIAGGMPLPSDVTAAELYLTLGENLYSSQTDGSQIAGYDPAIRKGIVWTYNRDAGLISIPVPGEIFGDALTIRASRRALRLNPSMSPALSLLLMANSRRENNLPEGEPDYSYPSTWQPADFYLKMAGPLRQHDVLGRALRDGDTALALDAIAALNETAGTAALINRAGASQPLLDALSYPDRRVRFQAAFAMARAHPQEQFPGSHRVVAVLSEAVRQTDTRYALVVGKDQETVNQNVAMLSEQGFEAFGGISVESVADQINEGAGVDMVLVEGSVPQVVQTFRDTAQHYKLAAVPVLAIVTAGQEAELRRQFGEEPRLRTAQAADDPEAMATAIDRAAESYAGSIIESEEAENLALTALELLRDVSLSEGRSILVAQDAQPALEQAVSSDERDQVVIAAAEVLALLNNDEAQQTIAAAALDSTRYDEIRIAMLNSLANSAKKHGNKLTERQLDNLLELVENSVGDLAEAAAKAHGALTLPTSNVVQLLLNPTETDE